MDAHRFTSSAVKRQDHASSLYSTCLCGAAALLLLTMPASPARADETPPAEAQMIQHGRYLTQIAGCNDCHTAGYAVSGGHVPDADWLTGDSLGWRGPWGTTYPSNLRLLMQSLSEDQWVTLARTTQYRPPMPWFALRDMTDYDLRSIYHFIRKQGPAGQPAPQWVPPDKEPKGPYIQFPAPPPTQ